MSDPSSFYSFSDYLGLNDEAGQQMLDKSMGEGDKLKAGAEAASQAHYKAARAAGNGEVGGEEAYKRTGEQARTGLASYSDWAKGMADPHERRALMEKTYGSRVSWLDSATVGSGAAGVGKDLAATEAEFGDRANRADTRRGNYASQTATRASEQAAYMAARQAAEDARRKNVLGKQRALEEFDEEGTLLPQGLSQQEKEMYVTRMSRNRKSEGANGAVDWDAYFGEGAKRKKQSWDARPSMGVFDLSFGSGAPKDPSTAESWGDYQKRYKGTK